MGAEYPISNIQIHHISMEAERARRLGPHITAYRKKLGELSAPPDLRIELEEPVEHGWKMSTTDGVPIPTEHFLDDEPPYGDPL